MKNAMARRFPFLCAVLLGALISSAAPVRPPDGQDDRQSQLCGLQHAAAQVAWVATFPAIPVARLTIEAPRTSGKQCPQHRLDVSSDYIRLARAHRSQAPPAVG